MLSTHELKFSSAHTIFFFLIGKGHFRCPKNFLIYLSGCHNWAIFHCSQWNQRKSYMLNEPKAKLGYFILLFKTEGSHLSGAQSLIILMEL